MPELAEVEYHRRRWDCGVGQRVLRVELHAGKRIFRGIDLSVLQASLSGATLRGSEARGKQMLFRFSKQSWLGLHLGMTGNLRAEPAPFTAGKHDHLVLHQRKQALVFNDPRQFGRVLFHRGREKPAWWTSLPPALTSAQFTHQALTAFLQRHAKAPIKAVLLDQTGFPGVGNWMADEILWRAKIHPRTPAGRVNSKQLRELWRQTRFVCSGALRLVAPNHADPPASWLFTHRWEKEGRCPKDGVTLARASVGGRTTAWCPRCQGCPGPLHELLPRIQNDPRISCLFVGRFEFAGETWVHGPNARPKLEVFAPHEPSRKSGSKLQYVFSGVWPSSATASSEFSSVRKRSRPKPLQTLLRPGTGALR